MEIFKRQYDKLNAKLKSELTTAGAAPSQNLVTLEIKADRSSCASAPPSLPHLAIAKVKCLIPCRIRM